MKTTENKFLTAILAISLPLVLMGTIRSTFGDAAANGTANQSGSGNQSSNQGGSGNSSTNAPGSGNKPASPPPGSAGQ